ncbi:MAG TPA: glutathione S-transferase N-terminal domain-containing protein [Rhodanobacter sp.]|nr:glutathione S-transferase N-terminal domain-containing protein [Rhodanobacter sp.]
MKLFDNQRAPNPRRVRWCMAEKGIDDIEIVAVDIMKDEHRTPAFRARAGIAHVPVLVMDDGTAISESIAICRYLEGEAWLRSGNGSPATIALARWTQRGVQAARCHAASASLRPG